MSGIWYVDGAGSSGRDGFGKICVLKVGEPPVIMDVLISGVTNNTVEYLAMLEALRRASVGDFIYTDSKLVVGQLTQCWSVNFRHLQRMHGECAKLLREKPVEIFYIPREANRAGIALEKDSKRVFPSDGKTTTEVVDDILAEQDRIYDESSKKYALKNAGFDDFNDDEKIRILEGG